MSFHVQLQPMDDLHRILTSPQSLYLHIFTHDESELQTPIFRSEHPMWSPPYTFLCSDEQKLIFVLKSMDPALCHEPLCSGQLNLKSKPAQYWDHRKTKIILDGPYNSEVIINARLKWYSKKVTPFEGITELSGGNPTKISKQEYSQNTTDKSEKSGWHEMFFKGPCSTVNLFSFLDTRVKGQHFSALEKEIPK